MANPRVAVLTDEFTLKRASLDALDTLAANEGRDLTADEQTEYDTTVTRMEAIEKTVTKLNADSAKFDAAAAGNVAAGVTLQRGRSAARTAPRIELPTLGEQLLIRGQHALGGQHRIDHSGDYETLVRSFEDETLQRVVAHGVFADGLQPTTIEGDLVKFVDAQRYAVNSSRRLPLPDNHADTFKRPRLSTRTTVAVQAVQADILSSTRALLTGDTVTKQTFGGVVSFSEQQLDWTDPAMLGLTIEDLADSYAIETDEELCDAIETAVTEGTETVLSLTGSLADFTAAITAAALVVYGTAKKQPDTLYVAPDRFYYIVGLVDGDGRPAFPVTPAINSAGTNTAGVTDWGTLNVFGLNVVVDPNFSTNVMIVAKAKYVETYEQNKGLLTIASPSTLEVQYAYRGYFATNVYSQGLNGIEAA